MDAILLAAGSGSRSKLDYPKQLLMLGGKPLFIHALDLLKSIEEIDRIIVAVIPHMIEDFKRLINEYNHNDVICVAGGKIRQESVYNALCLCHSDRVLIHAASRPFVSKGHILDLISVNSDVVIPCVPLIPAALHKDGYYIDRDKVLCIQLPQVFKTDILKKAHELGRGKSYPEDSSMVYGELGIFPAIIDGMEQNIKITLPIDIKIADVIFNTFNDTNDIDSKRDSYEQV